MRPAGYRGGVLDLSSPALERSLAAAPDPGLARVSLARVAEHPDALATFDRPETLAVAVRLLGFSTAATDLLVAHPEEASALADVTARSRAALDAELGEDVERLGLPDGLRRFRRRAMLRVAARDLSSAPYEEVVAEISGGGGGVSRGGDGRDRRRGLAVVALGKLGGAELNYASDVDVVFVHEGSGPGAAGGGGARERRPWSARSPTRPPRASPCGSTRRSVRAASAARCRGRSTRCAGTTRRRPRPGSARR